jgi:ATP-dependent Lon protease
VGKTSLGRSIARALGRKFHRISLGGVHDEAAIRGHRRTYVGALPGQVIQGMKKAGTINPVFMLDEVDKIGHDFRGDPSAALLEVLDPEQNNTFADHYLEIPYDLSHVMFVATANIADPIPPPLKDRMEILEIPGYTRREKLAIAKQHLLPKQLSEHGLTTEQLEITDRAIEEIIDHYTREAGVRSLERQIASVIRGVAVKVAEGDTLPAQGRQRGRHPRVPRRGASTSSEVAERTSETGVATGLAWTAVGGEILFIEVDAHVRRRQAPAHRPARRRHEGERAGGAQLRAVQLAALRHREGLHGEVDSTSTSPPARCRRTARARV